MTPPRLRADCLLPEEVGGEVCVGVGDALPLVVVATYDCRSRRRLDTAGTNLGRVNSLPGSLIAAL